MASGSCTGGGRSTPAVLSASMESAEAMTEIWRRCSSCPPPTNVDDEGVTGKFGLGFKSVLLACEQPRILSGRLAMRVVSGILASTMGGFS